MKRYVLGLLLPILLLAPVNGARADFLDAGVVGVQRSGSGRLQHYSFSGTLTDTLQVFGLSEGLTGVSVISNRVFVMGGAGAVGEVDFTTGVVFNVFYSGGRSALGDNGTNLLTYNNLNGLLSEYTPDGSLVSTVTIEDSGAGVDGAPGRTYLGQFTGTTPGDIQEYDTLGNLLSIIDTPLPSASVTGLGYDRTNDTFWVATGLGDDKIRQFNRSGIELVSFAVPGWVNGLDVIPGSVTADPEPVTAVPEPTSLLILSVGVLGVLGVFGYDWRRRKGTELV